MMPVATAPEPSAASGGCSEAEGEPKRSGQAAVRAAQDATIFGFGPAETGKKASQSFVYDATNRLVEGTNWKGDTSAYTYNGLGLRVNNLVTTHAGKTYPGGYDAFIKDRMAYYTAVFRNSVNYKNQVRTYFNLLISCGN